MKSPYRADLETILHGQYVPGEPLARVMLGDADEFAVIQIADKYSKRRLLRTAKEFLHTGSAFWATGEELLLPEDNDARL
jgi:hypothetical protein